MKNLLIVIALFATFGCSFMVTAQQDKEPMLLHGRLRDSSWLRYRKGTHLIMPMPLFSAYIDGKKSIYQLGMRAEYGYFPINQLAVTASISYEKLIREKGNKNGNRQYLAANAMYFLLPTRRFSIYTKFSVYALRYQYTPHPGFVFMDDVMDNNKKTHYVPGAQLSVGTSIKFLKHFTVQFGAIIDNKFTDATGRVPDMKSYIALDFGMLYHINWGKK